MNTTVERPYHQWDFRLQSR